MKVTNLSKQRAVFLLRSPDEMRHPYESSIHSLGHQTRWFNSFDELLAASSTTPPLAVIVDLDTLEMPMELPLEQLRAAFSTSDLIALSSSDSAQLALLCIRSGFADFLLKPTSPEELGWSIRKSEQRHEIFKKLDSPKTNMVRVVTQISTCTTPTLVQLCTLEYLRTFLDSDGAAWIVGHSRKDLEVACSVPRMGALQTIKKLVPQKKWLERREPTILRSPKEGKRKLYLPCKDPKMGGVLLWGIEAPISREALSGALALLDHSELSLLNLRKYDEIKQQTFVDDLTGLYNSRFLKFALSNAILKCDNTGQSFSILFIDVDHFKSVNDTYGHVVGSEFLVAIGRTIRNAVRSIDPVFRYGGDEFVVVLQESPLEGAAEIGERIRKNIERRVFVIQGQRIQTTVSIGIATYPFHAKNRETLLRLADEAMYCAKKESRNAVHLAYGAESAPLKETGT